MQTVGSFVSKKVCDFLGSFWGNFCDILVRCVLFAIVFVMLGCFNIHTVIPECGEHRKLPYLCCDMTGNGNMCKDFCLGKTYYNLRWNDTSNTS